MLSPHVFTCGTLAGAVTPDVSHHPSVVVSVSAPLSPPQLSPRCLASRHPPKVIAIYRVALIRQSQPARLTQQGPPAGAASGRGSTSGGTCGDNGMRDNRKFGFGVEVISLEGFSISVCRSERAGLRLSLSGFIISGTGLSRPLSHEHPLSLIRDTESLSVSLFQISHLSVYHPPFPLPPLLHLHLFIIQRTHTCCFFSIYANGKDSRVAANAFLRAALFTLSMHIKWDMQRSCDLNSNYIQITLSLLTLKADILTLLNQCTNPTQFCPYDSKSFI